MGNKGPIRSKQSAHGGARVGVSGAGVSAATKGEAFQRTIINIIILIVIMSNTSIGSPIILPDCFIPTFQPFRLKLRDLLRLSHRCHEEDP